MKSSEKKVVLALVNALLDNAKKQDRTSLYRQALGDVAQAVTDDDITAIVRRDRLLTTGQLQEKITKHFEKKK